MTFVNEIDLSEVIFLAKNPMGPAWKKVNQCFNQLFCDSDVCESWPEKF